MDRHDTLLLACGSAENRKMFRSLLGESFHLLEAVNTRQALLLLNQNLGCIAAVLLDITDPAALEQEMLKLPEAMDLLDQVPVIVITAEDSHEMLTQAFGLGAADVIPVNYDSYAIRQRIENIVELNLHKRNLEVLVEEQAQILRHSNDAMVDALSSIIEYRSVESGQHILRIRHFTKILLEEVKRSCPEYGLTDGLISIISSASALHDIGKIAIPDAILTKPGKLTGEEMEVMRTHALTGSRILSSLGDIGNRDYLRYAHNICHYHHERWDGGGYPEGLRGDDIPICAQVVGLADVYDALTTKRVYKDAYTFETAVNMILNGECGAFSPKLLECFKHVTDQYAALARDYADGLSPNTEKFDVTLPPSGEDDDADGLEITRARYLALAHYMNVFLMEVDMGRGHYHLIYNPYPELAEFHGTSTFGDLEQLILEQVVAADERERMHRFLHHEVPDFMKEGLRRLTFYFRFRSRNEEGEEPFEVTLLRANPLKENQQRLSVLCRRIETAEASISEPDRNELVADLAESTYCCRYDYDFTLLHLGRNTGTLAGYTAGELKTGFGGRLMELVHPEDREMVRRRLQVQLKEGTSARLEYRVIHKNGSIMWLLCKIRMVLGSDGQEQLYSFVTDITPTRHAVEELHKKLDRYEIILAQTENVLFEWDIQADEISFSDTWEKIFGFSPISRGVRKALKDGSYFHPDDLPVLFDRISAMEKGSSYEVAEVRVANDHGRYLWCRFRASALRDENGKICKIAGIIINITEEKQAEQALQDRAEKDSLTRLLNKEAGRRQAEEYFATLGENQGCAMLIIDLDNFKQVNDQYGHLFGDAVLTQVAKEIKKQFRAQDIISRIGGDEFMVLMRGVKDRNLVESRCSRLVSIFRTTFRSEYYQLPLSCSVGVAMAPEHGTSYFDLFLCADKALYLAKGQGKNKYMFYNSKDMAFHSMQRQTTAVNNRIDSDEQPGLADSNLVQYAFGRLYASDDVDAAINDILTLVGQQMNVSRVYVFEDTPDHKFCNNTYEWCNEGIEPQIKNLQMISYETDIPNYDRFFNEEGIFYCPDVQILPKAAYDIVEPQGIKSMLHCAIRDNGVFSGFIGFDECINQRLWTKEQIRMLTYFSEMLSVFLLKKRAQERTAQRANDLSSILDNQNAWIYIIDPDSCRLKYLNAKTKLLAPEVKPGMRCYQALMGKNERCAGCPSLNIRQTKTDNRILYNDKFDLQVLAEATLIQWEGEQSCLLTCRELSDFQNYKKDE